MAQNLDTDSTFTFEQFGPTDAGIGTPLVLPSGTTFVATVNGLSGSLTFAGGTSGFTFAPSGAVVSLVSPLTTKGDLLVRNGTQGIRLGVGADTFVLTADSSTASGVKWAAVSGGTSPIFAQITPAQITANQNDYNPGVGDFFRLSSDASRDITGFTGGTAGKPMLLANIGAQNIVLTNQDILSAAANRLITGTGGSVILAPDDTGILLYDGTTARWRLFA